MKHHVSYCLFIMPVQRQNGPINRLIYCKCSPLSLCCTYKSYLSVTVLLLALKYYRQPYTSSDWSVSSARHDTTGSKASPPQTVENIEAWTAQTDEKARDLTGGPCGMGLSTGPTCSFVTTPEVRVQCSDLLSCVSDDILYVNWQA
jgi:hypothetical protein